jgi:type I restriction enzyme, S subunit
VIRIPNIQKQLLLDSLIYVEGISDEMREQFRVKPGWTLIVGSNGNPNRVGNCAFVSRPIDAVFASFLIGAFPRDEEKIDPSFMFYVLSSDGIQSAISESVQGSTGLKNINLALLRSLQIALPSLHEQRKIVAILSSVDEIIEKTGAVIEQLRVAQRAVMQMLLRRGLPGDHRKYLPLATEWKLGRLEGVEEIPETWKLVHLTTVARLESGHTPSKRNPEYWNGDIPWVSLHDSKHLDVHEILETAQRVSRLGIDNSSARLLPRGTVVFSRTATVGKSTVLGRDMATSQDFANYVCGENIYNRYLMHLFRNMGREWTRLMAGSTHKTIYMPVFQELQILLPPKREQEAIASVGDLLESRVSAEKNVLDALQLLKAPLLHSLLSGEIRVQPDEPTP